MLARAPPVLPPARGKRTVQRETATGTRWCASAKPCATQVRIPPVLLGSEGDFGPQNPGKSRRLLRQHCRALGCRAGAVPLMESQLCPGLKTARK